MEFLVLLGYMFISWGIFILLFSLCLFIFNLYYKNKSIQFILYNKPINNDIENQRKLFEYPIYILKYDYPKHKTCYLKVDLSNNDKYIPKYYYNNEIKNIILNKIEKYYNLISPLILDKIYIINQKYNAHYDNHIKNALVLHCFHIAYKYNLNVNQLINNIDNIFKNINLNHFTIFYMFNFSNILYNQFWTIPKNNDGWLDIYNQL